VWTGYLFLSIILLLATGCRLFEMPKDGEPRRGSGAEFDDELDPITSPLHGVTLCSSDGPCETPDRRARGTLQNGQPEGDWTLFGPRGVRVGSGVMKSGKAHGLWKRWSAGGTLIEEGRWLHGKPHGVWRMYRSDGQLFEELTFVDGLRDGPWTMLHPNGQIAEHMVWAKGKQIGLQTDYSAAGVRLARGQFEDHRPVGEWVCWDSSGKQRTVPAPTSRLTPAEVCGHANMD